MLFQAIDTLIRCLPLRCYMLPPSRDTTPAYTPYAASVDYATFSYAAADITRHQRFPLLRHAIDERVAARYYYYDCHAADADDAYAIFDAMPSMLLIACFRCCCHADFRR